MSITVALNIHGLYQAHYEIISMRSAEGITFRPCAILRAYKTARHRGQNPAFVIRDDGVLGPQRRIH